MAYFFFFQAEDGIRDDLVTGVQTCALPICEDFTGRFVREQSGPELAGDQLAAVIDWRGAVEGLERGELACSGSELSVLKIAASLAAGCPVSLRLGLGGVDHVDITLVAGGVLAADGTV